MENLAGLLKELVARVASFFDLFDLSYFISGGMSLLALRYLLFLLDARMPAPPGEVLPVMITVLLAYVLGHLCFAISRQVRRQLIPSFTRDVAGERKKLSMDQYLGELMRAHQLDSHPEFKRYLPRPGEGERARAGDLSTLYPLMWAEMRQNAALAPSQRLLAQYWVRAAIYDGLVPALWLWVFALLAAYIQSEQGVGNPWFAFPAMLILIYAASWCFCEAHRCDRYQMDELAATLRWWLDHPRDTPPTGSP